MSIRLMNDKGVHKIYCSFKQDDPFIYIDDHDFDILIKKQFLGRYQSAVKKHLNIKNADYNSDYITVLQMVKIWHHDNSNIKKIVLTKSEKSKTC